MKKIITLLTAIILIFSFSVCYAADMNFTDVKMNDWYYKNLQELVQKNIASGYPDGTFKSGNTLKFEEFIKMLIVATGEELTEQKEGQEWYQIYVDKALEGKYKYITDEQKSLIGQNIDRKTMAEILYNLLNEKEDITAYTEAELEYLSGKLTDINKTDVKTLTINGRGVISGYPDGTFKPAGTLTRAEAVAVISRVINPALRNPVNIVLRDNGIIDAKDLESIPIENTGYQELIDYKEVNRIRDNKLMYEVENVIKADVSMFPMRFGPLVITGIEKLPAEKAPYYGDTSIGWKGTVKDAIIIHAYPVEKSDDNESTIGLSPSVLRVALIYKSGEIIIEAPTTVLKTHGGENVYNKTKEMFPDYAIGDYPRVELYNQFTIMILGKEGVKLEDIDKVIFMDTRWYSSTATRDVLEIDASSIKEIK